MKRGKKAKKKKAQDEPVEINSFHSSSWRDYRVRLERMIKKGLGKRFTNVELDEFDFRGKLGQGQLFVRFTLLEEDEDGNMVSHDEQEFKFWSARYGIAARMFGKQVRVFGQDYTLVGWNQRNRKYKVIAARAKDGRKMKLAASAVKDAIDRQRDEKKEEKRAAQRRDKSTARAKGAAARKQLMEEDEEDAELDDDLIVPDDEQDDEPDDEDAGEESVEESRVRKVTVLTKKRCKCGSKSLPKLVSKCTCGISRNHTHCPQCGGVRRF